MNRCALKERKLYSISEARALMGAISRNTMYALLNRGEIASVVIGCRRFVTQEAISEFIERSTTTAGPAVDPARFRKPLQPAGRLGPPPPTTIEGATAVKR
jgi:Helix-turn-helix domain